MRVLTEGHEYRLSSFEGGTSNEQNIKFIYKRSAGDLEKSPNVLWLNMSQGEKEKYLSTDLVTMHDGTTNEDVLAVLIDRMKYLQDKFPCKENELVISKLEESLMWLEKRTRDRKNRGVEGKHIK